MESRGKRLVALCKNVNVQMLSEEEASNHNSAQNDSTSTDDEPLSVKRNRWTKSQPEKWKKNVMKEKRSMGQPYRSTKGILRPAKTPKPADGCKFKCTTKFSDEERKSICNDYWKLDYCRQKDFILSCVVNTPPKCHRIRTGTGVPKTSSRKYHLKRNSDCIQVCKAFFLGTLSISHDPIDNAIAGVNNNGLFNAVDKRGRKTPSNKTPDQDIQRIKNHIESFPTMESHYCRKNTKRQYLDPSLSITKLYDLLKDESGEKVCWLKINIMRYEKSRPGCILFKYNYDEVAYHILHVYGRGRPPNIPNLIPRLYSGLQPITEKKKNCLLRLCSSDGIPEEYHAWYKSIPVDTQKRTTVPEPANDSDSESESDVIFIIALIMTALLLKRVGVLVKTCLVFSGLKCLVFYLCTKRSSEELRNMATRSKDQNLYHKVSAKIRFISEDIGFLKTCKRFSVFPNFINVTVSNNCKSSDKVIRYAKEKWLRSEIEYLFAKRSKLEIQAYQLWKFLTLDLNDVEYQLWCDFQRNMFISIDRKVQNKKFSHDRKLRKLGCFLKNKHHIPMNTMNIVENHSSQTFSERELNLLNKGLKFGLQTPESNVETFREDVKASPIVTLPYAPFITKGLSKIFKELDLRIVYSSGNSLRSLIGNPKDKIQPLEKSGIYEINCKDCNQKYIGQTRRAVSTRFKEHMAHLRFNRIEKSSVAQHIFETDHNIDHTNVKLIR
ncbi:dna-directed rna polymerases i ii and iii subunit rpabc2 [Holotrichia oblita]|uniref:Dna-directed rna polymerases i ii and iii subunit rpabc2 n=1 Tax=Holotrichia oblita TaxID=644536 RepID=A0ACB9TGI4_HOLOL|nr:dna-directed rna polymerases i ii and iii subunit rpabc2 [Holotrichia oblita]